MRAEVAPLLARLEAPRTERSGDCSMIAGRLGEIPLVVAWTGEGALLAERGVNALLDRFPVNRLLIVGVAGGLSPQLGPGALVLGTRIVDGAGGVASPDARWLETGLDLGLAQAGTVLTTKRILCSPASKELAWSRLRDDAPAVVDLESAVFARVAGKRGVGFLVVRAVSDTSDEAMPLDFNACIDETGRVSRSRVVRQALRRPASLRSLWELRRRVSACAKTLAGFTERLLTAEAP